MEPIIQTEKLSHVYSVGTPFEQGALVDVDFAAYRGESLGVIGRTGSGKSTLIQHLNGLLRPTQGRILLDGKDIWAEPKKIRQVRFQVGLVFQYPEYQLFEETVYKDIAFGPINQGKTGEELDRCVREAARLVGIRDDQLDKSPFELSGGQKRRVALAGVMAMDPQVLVLDEPSNHLDIKYQLQLMELVRGSGCTVVAAIHDLNLAAAYCHRLYALKDGVIVGEGAPKELLTPAFLREVYEVEAEVLTGRDGSLRVFFYPSRIS